MNPLNYDYYYLVNGVAFAVAMFFVRIGYMIGDLLNG